jgi:tetratricopeptide (TPR) repeat protein
MTLLTPANTRRSKPGLELSFSSSLGLATIEAHSERARIWLVDRFGKVTESIEPRLTTDIPNLGFVIVTDDIAAKVDAEAANFGFVTQWNPASQKEIDLQEKHENARKAKLNAEKQLITDRRPDIQTVPAAETSGKKSRSPYRQNAFFLLDVRADASIQEIRRLQNRAEVLLGMGKVLESTVLPFLRRNQTTREDILSAVQRLEDGQARIREEIYWVHAGPKGDSLPGSAASLSPLVSLLEKASQGSGRQAAIAAHNLAVVNHALAFEQEFAKGVSPQTRQEAWAAAYFSWRSVSQNEEFWDFMSERVASWDDPTVSDSDLQRARRELSEELLRPHRLLAMDYIAAGNHESARLHIQLLQEATKWQPVAKRYLSEISTELVRQVQGALDAVVVEVSEQALIPLQNEQKKERLTSAEQRVLSIGNVAIANLSLFPGMQESSDLLGDQIAGCLRSLSIRYFNQLDDSQNSLRVLALALRYARTPSCKAQIALDQSTIQCRALCNLSFEAANKGQYKTAQEYLEQAKNLAPETEVPQIDEWLETCKRNRILEGVDTKHNTPALGRVNGIGAAFYGKRDYDPATNSYVTTQFFTFLFVPVIPIAAYRVVSLGGNSYRIFGKVPLSKLAVRYRWLVLAAVGVLVIYSMIQSTDSPSSSGTGSASPSVYSSPTYSAPTTSPSSSYGYQSRDAEKEDLDRTRQELDSRESALRTEQESLDSLKAQLDSLKRQIQDLEDQYPDGMPPYVHDEYEAKLAQHNRLVPVYNQRLTSLQAGERQYDQDVANFNARVRAYNSQQ